MTPVTLTPDEIRGHLAMLGFSALVAGSFSLGALVANDIDPQAITVWGGASCFSSALNSAGENLTVTTGPLWPTKSNLLPQSPRSSTEAV